MTLTQISTNGIKDANVNTADIADDAVTTAKIASNAVTSSKIAGSAVHSSKIIDAAVTTGKIADSAIISSKIADSAVSGSKLGSSVVSSTKIQDNAVTTTKIADEAVTLAKLPHGTSSNDGKFLRANNGADPSFETVSIPAGTTINSNTNNYLITGTGIANTLQGESGLTYNGSTLGLSGSLAMTGGGLSLDGHPLVGTASFTDISGGSYSARLGSTGSSTIRSTQIYGGGNHIATFDGVNMRFGIGTTTPNRVFEINNSQPCIRLTNGTNAYDIGTGGFVDGSDSLCIHDQGQGERLRIDSSGNFYIGLTTTAYPKKLNLQGSSGSIIHLNNYDTTTYAANTSTAIEFNVNTGNTGNQTGACEIRAFKENGTNGNNARALSFYTGANGVSPAERLRIESSGFISNTYKPVKTIQNTPVTDGSGDRFSIALPNTSRMFRVTGSFKFDGNGGTYRIWGDLGSWSDSHSPALEGFANWWVNGATGDLEQDVISGRYFEVADPVDASSCEVTYDLLITTEAFNGTAGGQRPGVSGNISWTYSQVGRAWSVFSYQDINATGSDRLTHWSWDIDGISGTLGTGTHQYVVEEYPLTAQ